MNWDALFPENPLKRAAMQFIASIEAHALVELGFEEHINEYDARTLAMIGSQSGNPIRYELYAEAIAKASPAEREHMEGLL
jgi:hypothetical protein